MKVVRLFLNDIAKKNGMNGQRDCSDNETQIENNNIDNISYVLTRVLLRPMPQFVVTFYLLHSFFRNIYI